MVGPDLLEASTKRFDFSLSKLNFIFRRERDNFEKS